MADAFDAAHELAQAQAELDLRAARIAGLERLIGQAEQLGRVSAAVSPSSCARSACRWRRTTCCLSRVPALVRTLRRHLIQARNQYGLRVAEMRRLAAQAEALEKERNDLLARVDAAELELETRPPATRGPRPGAIVRAARHPDGAPRFPAAPSRRDRDLLVADREGARQRHDVHLFFTEARPDVPSYRCSRAPTTGCPSPRCRTSTSRTRSKDRGATR